MLVPSSGDELEFTPVWLRLELSVESDVPELGVGGVGASSRLFSEPSLLDLTCARENLLYLTIYNCKRRKVKSASSRAVHTPEAYPRFYFPVDGMIVLQRIIPCSKFACSHIIIQLVRERHCDSVHEQCTYPDWCCVHGVKRRKRKRCRRCNQFLAQNK